MTGQFLRLAALIALTAVLSLPGAPSRAGSNLRGLVTMDMLDGGRTGRGTYMVALRLTLADGWKTYWRVPGEAGIPPQFDWGRARNVGAVAAHWPTPKAFDQNGFRSIGYTGELVLPLEITPAAPDQPVRLRGRMVLGVCSDICVPGTLKIDHVADPGATMHPAITKALANRPRSAARAGVRAATCRLTPTADGVRIEARITMPPAGGAEVAVIEPANPKLWTYGFETARRGGVLIATSDLVNGQGGALAVDRSRLRLTVLGDRYAVDIRGCTPG